MVNRMYIDRSQLAVDEVVRFLLRLFVVRFHQDFHVEFFD